MDQLAKPTLTPARLQRKDVPATYNRLAPFHDLMARTVERTARLRAFQLARLENGQDVLEVGVGTGLNMSFVLDRNPDGTYVGIDVAPGMLERARRRLDRLGTAGLNYRLLPGDAYGLEFADSTFDLIVSTYMFDLLPADDFVTVITEFRRVLRPGGQALIINMAPDSRFLYRMWEVAYAAFPSLLGGCRGVRLEPFVAESGLEMIERSFVSQWTFQSEILLCKKPDSDFGPP